MRLFYQAFPNCDALRHELSWMHYRSLLRVEDAQARAWYMNEAAAQNWSARSLDRQIGTLYYERLLASKDRRLVREEAETNLSLLEATPRDDTDGGKGAGEGDVHALVVIRLVECEARIGDDDRGTLQAFETEECFGNYAGSGLRAVGAHDTVRSNVLAVDDGAGFRGSTQ